MVSIDFSTLDGEHFEVSVDSVGCQSLIERNGPVRKATPVAAEPATTGSSKSGADSGLTAAPEPPTDVEETQAPAQIIGRVASA